MSQENKPRFFSFGCSYTRYHWPTWADIIGQQYQLDYYNYGRMGAGNIFIFNMLMQADQFHKFTKDDVVVVQWSSIIREDRYIKSHWVTKGSVFNLFPRGYINKFFDMRGSLIRDIALVKAAKTFLENIGCKFYFISMCGLTPLSTIDDDIQCESSDSDRDVIELYKDVVDFIKPSFYDVIGTYTNRPFHIRENIYMADSHKIPSEHSKYINEVLPDFLVDKNFVEEADYRLIQTYNELDHATYYPWDGFYRGVSMIKTI